MDAPVRDTNAKLMGECWSAQTINSKENGGGIIPSVLIKDWIVTNPKYKHLFSGIHHFKCGPVKIEMKPDAEPVRKAARRVPLALKDKFTKEIQSMVDSGILTKLTPGMPMPECQCLNGLIVLL